MNELVENITRALVKNPDAVSVNVVHKGSLEIYQIQVAPEDMGKVIGKKGRVIHAVRSLVQAAALKEGKRVAVEIVE